MPAYHDVGQGDMYIEYSVVLPTEVSDTSRRSKSRMHASKIRLMDPSAELIDIFGQPSGGGHFGGEL